MKSFTAITLLTLLASTVSGQNSNGCSENFDGTFEIAPYNITDQIPPSGPTVCTVNPIVSLKNGVLTDQQHRTGEVVANHQFQFDDPIQGPTTSGFSICSNGSLALNGKAIWFGCLSGDFSNLYDQPTGAQCHLVYIVTYPCSGGSSAIASSPSVSSTSSSTSSSSSSTSSSTMTTSTTPVVVAPPPTSTTSTTATSAPFPVGNSTAPAGTATGAMTTTATPSSTQPASFKGAANMVAVGGKVVALVAGVAVFALF